MLVIDEKNCGLYLQKLEQIGKKIPLMQRGYSLGDEKIFINGICLHNIESGKTFFSTKKVLGKGAFGEVLVCVEVKTGVHYALKSQRYYKSIVENQVEGNKLFGKDSEIYGPWIDEKASVAYIVTPLAQTSLLSYLNASARKLAPKELLLMVLLIAKNLKEIHAKGKVHCDLKLDNILLYEDKKAGLFIVKISDFGTMKDKGDQGRTINADHRVYSHYPPEYFLTVTGKQIFTVDPSFDVWSFGKLLKHLSQFTTSIDIYLNPLVAHCCLPDKSARINMDKAIKYLETARSSFFA